MTATLLSREQSDGKRCPNCTSEGKGYQSEHDASVHQKQVTEYLRVIDVGWRCWNCGYEWGFESAKGG